MGSIRLAGFRILLRDSNYNILGGAWGCYTEDPQIFDKCVASYWSSDTTIEAEFEGLEPGMKVYVEAYTRRIPGREQFLDGVTTHTLAGFYVIGSGETLLVNDQIYQFGPAPVGSSMSGTDIIRIRIAEDETAVIVEAILNGLGKADPTIPQNWKTGGNWTFLEIGLLGASNFLSLRAGYDGSIYLYDGVTSAEWIDDVTLRAYFEKSRFSAGEQITIRTNTVLFPMFTQHYWGYGEFWFDEAVATYWIGGSPSFDFGLSVTPMSRMITMGQTASYEITVYPIAGTAQQVSLEVSGLPPGSSVSLIPEQGEPPFTSTLLITTSSTTPPGTYMLTVTGTSNDLTRSASIYLTIEPDINLYYDSYFFTYSSEGLSFEWRFDDVALARSRWAFISSRSMDLLITSNVPIDNVCTHDWYDVEDCHNYTWSDAQVVEFIMEPEFAIDPKVVITRSINVTELAPDTVCTVEITVTIVFLGNPTIEGKEYQYVHGGFAIYQPVWPGLTFEPLGQWRFSFDNINPSDEITFSTVARVHNPYPYPVRFMPTIDLELFLDEVLHSQDCLYGENPLGFQVQGVGSETLWVNASSSNGESWLACPQEIHGDIWLWWEGHWKPKSILKIECGSPINLLVTDPRGRKVGFDPEKGAVVNEVPGAEYNGPDSEPEVIIIPDPLPIFEGTYLIQVIGTGEGHFSLTVEWDDYSTGSSTCEIYEGLSYQGVTNTYVARITETGTRTMLVASVDIDPDTLNLASSGKWITVYIELPSSYDLNKIDRSSITLTIDGSVFKAVAGAPFAVGDYDRDGVPDLIVKFNRTEIVRHLSAVDLQDNKDICRKVEFLIAGFVGTTPFEGTDIVQLIYPKNK
ncbi:MAG: hypothetical protein QXH17_08035 [Candidatus Bathyarchaeia archaeon]